MRTTALRTALSAAFFLVAATAAADDGPGNDQVRLKSGGMVRGTIVESEPGGVVKVVVAGEKQPKVIPWGDVAGLDFEKFAPKPAAAPPTPPEPPPPTPPPPAAAPPPPPVVMAEPPPGVLVHIESPEQVLLHSSTDTVGSVYLYRITLSQRRTLCVSPCDETIDVMHEPELSIGGDGVTESARFTLTESMGDVHLDVSPGSRGTYLSGLWLATGGAGMLVGGLVLVALEASGPAGPANSEGMMSPGGESGLVTAGAVVAGVGGAMLIGGIVAIVRGRTTVTMRRDRAATAARAPNYWAGES